MSYAKQISAKYRITPTKKLGQNFLVDESIIADIVLMSDVKKSTVLEIGPGTGNMTKALLNAGALKVIAVEFDPSCVKALKELELQYDNLKVIQGDALNFKEEEYGEGIKIVANLPYNIGTALLFKWFQNIRNFSTITIMLQKEVVERIVAVSGTKDYGSLSVISQFLCNVEKLFDVPKEAFWPIPNVTSSVVRLIPRDPREYECSLDDLDVILKAAFAQKRKMLRNNLKNIITHNIDQVLEKCGIPITSRAEELSVRQFSVLTKEIIHS